MTVDAESIETNTQASPENTTPPPPSEPSNPESTQEPSTKTQSSTTFPDNWQELMSGGDEKLNTLLSRYSSPAEVAKSLSETKKKVSEGIKKPGANATEEEIKEWQKAWGVPETPEGYNVYDKFKNDISENDKAIVDDFVKEMHASHATPDVVEKAIDTYYRIQEKNMQYLEEVNQQDALACEEDLREEYGRNYKDNVNRALSHIETMFGKDASQLVTKAIGADGRMLVNNPDVMRAFVNMALENNPRVTMPSDMKSLENMEAEKAQIRSLMGTAKYTPDVQARYQKILETEARLKPNK